MLRSLVGSEMCIRDSYMPDDATDMAAIYSGRYEVLPREWGELLAPLPGAVSYTHLTLPTIYSV